MSANPLFRVRQAAAAKDAAEQEYRSAICDAHVLHGVPYVHLAEVLGIARSTVRTLVLREQARREVKL